MMKQFRYLVLIALVLWCSLWMLVAGPHLLLQPVLDIQMHNTYFVIGGYLVQFFTLLFSLLGLMAANALRQYAIRSPATLILLGSSSVVLLVSIQLFLAHYQAISLALPLPTSSTAISGFTKAVWVVEAGLLFVALWAGTRVYRRFATPSR